MDKADLERLGAADRNHPVYDYSPRDWTGDVYGIPQ